MASTQLLANYSRVEESRSTLKARTVAVETIYRTLSGKLSLVYYDGMSNLRVSKKMPSPSMEAVLTLPARWAGFQTRTELLTDYCGNNWNRVYLFVYFCLLLSS